MDNFTLESNIEKAKKYIEQNNIEYAIDLLEFLKKKFNNNFDVFFELGKAYLICNDNFNAVSNLKCAKEIKDNEYVNLLLAKSLREIKESKRSINLLLKLKKSESELKDIDKEIIRILIDKKKYVFAKKYIDKYINIENIGEKLVFDFLKLAKSLREIKESRRSINLLLKLKKSGNKLKDIDKEIIRILIDKRKYIFAKKYIDKYLNNEYYHLFEDTFKENEQYSKNQLFALENVYFNLLSYDIDFKLKFEIELFRLYLFNIETTFIKKNKFIEYLINKLNICEYKFKKFYNFMVNKIETIDKNIYLKSKPINLSVCLTSKCNARCKFCDIFNNHWEISNKIYEELLFLIPYLHSISWSGGEVFLYKNFKNLFDLAKKYDIRQEIVTNAMLLDENWMNELITSNTKLAFSIRSVDKNKYESLTNGADFNKLIKNLEYINSILDKRHYKFELSMYILVTKYNYMNLESLIDFAKEYNFNNVRLIQLDNTENPIHDENICDKKSKYYIPLKKSLNKLIEKAKKYNIMVRCELPIIHDEIYDGVQNDSKRSINDSIKIYN